ncbi:hypothetical protein Tco_0379361 [Tanacetum coccineum]
MTSPVVDRKNPKQPWAAIDKIGITFFNSFIQKIGSGDDIYVWCFLRKEWLKLRHRNGMAGYMKKEWGSKWGKSLNECHDCRKGCELVGSKLKWVQQNVPLSCSQGRRAHQIRPEERCGQQKEWQENERKGLK